MIEIVPEETHAKLSNGPTNEWLFIPIVIVFVLEIVLVFSLFR